MRLCWRRKLVVLPVLLVTLLVYTADHLATRWSCTQARRARTNRRNIRTAMLRSQQVETLELKMTGRSETVELEMVGRSDIVELEMVDRSEHIQGICEKYQLRKDDIQGCRYRSVEPSFDQIIGNHFLGDPRTGSVYCFIHKVGMDMERHMLWPL